MVEPSVSSQAGDLSSCNSEPVQFIAATQGHGSLLFFSVPDYRIQAASENTGAILGFEHTQVLGARLEHIIDTQFFELVTAQVREFPWSGTNGRYLTYEKEDKTYEAWLFHSDGLFGLDLETNQFGEHGTTEQIRIDQVIKEYMVRAKECDTMPKLATALAQTIRRLTAIDRVMIYRFLPTTWHGEVVAEDRNAKAHSYMAHRFPASDIPKPARDLYLRNQVRMIPNVQDSVAKISPAANPVSKKPIDLSDSRLRAVSPVHLEYLKNMGVGASFSVAITHGGQLWGLIACHHLSPCYIPNIQRSACEVVANAFAAQGPIIEQLNDNEATNEFNSRLRTLFGRLRSARSPKEELFRQHRLATEIFNANGVAYVDPKTNSLDMAGVTPPRTDIERLAEWTSMVMNRDRRDLLAINDLPVINDEFDNFRALACGVLALKVDELTGAQFMFFRPEVAQTIVWGGDPRKQLDKKNFQGRIHPRASFEAWEEVVQGHSKPWSVFEMEGAAFFKDVIFDALVKKENMITELSDKVHRLN